MLIHILNALRLMTGPLVLQIKNFSITPDLRPFFDSLAILLASTIPAAWGLGFPFCP